jgi:polyphosphate kinase
MGAARALLERVKLCGIFASNLDEFFEVRVAGLLDQVAAAVSVRSPDRRTAAETLAEACCPSVRGPTAARVYRGVK